MFQLANCLFDDTWKDLSSTFGTPSFVRCQTRQSEEKRHVNSSTSERIEGNGSRSCFNEKENILVPINTRTDVDAKLCVFSWKSAVNSFHIVGSYIRLKRL